MSNKRILEIVLLSATAIIFIVLLVFWFLHNPVKDFKANIPGMDNRPARDTSSIQTVKIGEFFKAFTNNNNSELRTTNSELTGKWQHFRGADFDNINKENIKLIDNWGNAGPKILWKVQLGEGYAAPAIYNGKVFILDYDEIKKADALRCFSLETGKELWRRSYSVNIKRNHGISRTIPSVTDKYVVTIGPNCHVMCCNSQTGDYLWGIDLAKEYNTEVPLWYTGQCPLIDNDIAVIAPAGSSLLIGIDCASGKLVWKTPNCDNWKMSHSSIMPMTIEGKKFYVYCANGGICGVSAEGEDRGKILWQTAQFKPSVVAASPVLLDKGKIFISGAYGYGAALLQVIKKASDFSVNVIQMYKPSGGLASETQTPIYFNKHLFAILPKDAGSSRNEFVCCNPDDCTKILWTSSKSERFGLGPYILADSKFFILNDDGTMTIAKADISHFVYLDKAKITNGEDAWGPMAIADGRLIMRDSKQMVCLDIRATKN